MATRKLTHPARRSTPADDEATQRERLREVLQTFRGDADAPLWLVLIGHGTFDGREAKFNLDGPDVSATELAAWVEPLDRPLAVINCASSSGPFVNRLSAPNRVVITAAKSGFEQNFARFGGYLSESIADPAADLDKDGQTSLLEAWLAAARRTEEFYRTAGRLATEHSLLEDNGDGRAARADFFRGIHPVKSSQDGAVDGLRAHQLHLVKSDAERRMPAELRRRRDELELAVFRLRARRAELDEAEYYRELESLLVPLAEVYEQVESARAPMITGGADKVN